MKKLFEKLLLIAIGLGLALYLHLGLYERPPGMKTQSSVSTDSLIQKFIELESEKIVGIRRQIDFSADDQGSVQISHLWKAFFDDSKLQSLTNWSDSQTVIAYYDNFSEEKLSCDLTIGFPEANITDAADFTTISMSRGHYSHFDLDFPTVESVSLKWQEIMKDRPYPNIVIERYALDTMGQPQEIQMQVLFDG